MVKDIAEQVSEIDAHEDFKLLSRLMDLAVAARENTEKVERELDPTKLKLFLKDSLRRVSDVTGENVSDTEIDSAIGTYLLDRYDFKVPSQGINKTLAEAYVDRERIAKKYGIPIAALLTAAGIAWGAINVGGKISQTVSEHRVERRVEEAYKQKATLEGRLQNIMSSQSFAEMPSEDKSGITQSELSSKKYLDITNDFFKEFCPNGASDEAVNKSNYYLVDKQVENTSVLIESAQKEIDTAEKVISTQEKIVSTRSSLDSLITEVRNLNPGDKLRESAETLYKTGVDTLEKRDLASGASYESQLAHARDVAKKLPTLRTSLDQVYTDVKLVAVEESAREKAAKIYDSSTPLFENADVDNLERNLTELENIDQNLKLSYTIKIVTRSRVKSGIDRYYTDENGKRASGYYLIVEAVDDQGNIVPVDILNEEDGKKEKVSMWGERVPQEIYERIKRDKMDNGIIEDNVFAVKPKGYITDKVEMKDSNGQPLPNAGDITRW